MINVNIVIDVADDHDAEIEEMIHLAVQKELKRLQTTLSKKGVDHDHQ